MLSSTQGQYNTNSTLQSKVPPNPLTTAAHNLQLAVRQPYIFTHETAHRNLRRQEDKQARRGCSKTFTILKTHTGIGSINCFGDLASQMNVTHFSFFLFTSCPLYVLSVMFPSACTWNINQELKQIKTKPKCDIKMFLWASVCAITLHSYLGMKTPLMIR